MTVLVSRESLRTLLAQAEEAKRVHIIGRALVGLYARQTLAEQNAETTTESNNVGFASCDAKAGSLTAQAYQRRGTLNEWQVAKWMRADAKGFPRICKYHRQLNELAIEKANRRQLSLAV